MKIEEKAKCPYEKKCGGCKYQGIPYEKQLKEKEKKVRKLLKDFGKPEPIMGMDDPYYYRNKVHATYKHMRTGDIAVGRYEEGSHRLVPIDVCQIENQKADEVIQTIRKLAKSFKIKIYNEDSGYGLLRHVLIRTGRKTGEMLVVLVTASPVFPSKNNFVKALRKEHPEVTSVVLNINDKKTSMILGERNIVLYGKGYIQDELCGYTFRISPHSFYQINPVQTERLYKKAIRLADLKGKERVLDAYCGIGTIGMIASKHAKEVIGVELNREAVKDAIGNAKGNGVKNIRFYQADAGEFMVAMAERGEGMDVVFMDPPRAGSAEAFLQSVARLAPKKIVYISCNPETMARDLKYLTKKKYEVSKICPVDMFPFTEHVETVVLLSRKTPDDTIEVDLDLDELDITAAESKATYQEIKDYVLKEFGLKVSTLYISQIKRKCGIDVGEHYNISQKENQKVPQCPKEKEDAIRAALEHFAMI